MLVNRLADREFDAGNPRTARRAIASGRVPVGRAWGIAVASALAFAALCALFWVFFGNAWPLLLSAPVLAWIAFYSYTKRFTALCHVFLGGALAVSPLAGAVAIGGMEALVAHLGALSGLALFVLFWVAGFDIAYALQDLGFDRERGLRSVPASLGWRGAMWVSRAMHAIALASLAFVPVVDERLTIVTWSAVVITGVLLVFEHGVLHTRGLAGLPMAFFTVNGVVSLVLGVMIAVDILL